MALHKPYKRIFRPMIAGDSDDYVTDVDYANDRHSFVHSFYLIEKDLKELFDFISPNNTNSNTFSHRIYELFFRSCTEFENNARSILSSNGYVSTGSNMNISNDFFKINQPLKLNEYEIKVNMWEHVPLILTPFSPWNSQTYVPLTWYANYNAVKHNRTTNFQLANLVNLMNSVAGLLIVLFAQYEYFSFTPYTHLPLVDPPSGFCSVVGSIFEIKPPNWSDEDKYDFDWNTLKNSNSPFEMFQF